MSEYMEDPEVAARVRRSIAEGEQAMASDEPMVTLDSMRTRSRPRWTAMKLRARAIAAAWRGDAAASDRLLRAASDAEQKTEPAA